MGYLYSGKATLSVESGESPLISFAVTNGLRYYLAVMGRRLKNVHPGEVLAEEFLTPLGVSAYRLAKEIGVPATRVSEILHGRRAITADTALRLAKYFGTSAKFWLGLQEDYDLEEESLAKAKELKAIVPLDQTG